MKNQKSSGSLLVVISVALMLICTVSRGQFIDTASGLLQCPSADMNPAGTFMITSIYLNEHTLSPRWGWGTFGYGISISLFSRVEIGYVMTLINGKWHNVTPIMRNQDRHFYGKVLLLKEGDFGKNWIPSLTIGVSDPVTGSSGGEYIGSKVDGSSNGNGFFNRNYIVATKHFDSHNGLIGVHLGYQYNVRKDIHYNGPCLAVDWTPIWLQKENLITTKLIAEYDARTFNIGAIVSFWRDHFEVMFDLQAMKWISAGVRYKVVLK